MKPERYYHLAVAALVAVAICTVISASGWLVAALGSFGVFCCQIMKMPDGRPTIFWPVSLAVLLALVGSGLWAFSKRLWQTHRFVSGLRQPLVAAPPARIAKLAKMLKLSRYVLVLRTETPLAFCYGLWAPRICISTGLAEALTNKELTAVLLHEDHHRRRADPLRKLMAESLGAALFFLPIAAELRDIFLTSLELEADRYATAVMGRPALAGALHKTLTHPLSIRSAHFAGLTGLSATEARIAELLDQQRVVFRLSARSLLLTSAVILLACWLAQNPFIY
jgi:Zn-dependent protease with chaperone function